MHIYLAQYWVKCQLLQARLTRLLCDLTIILAHRRILKTWQFFADVNLTAPRRDVSSVSVYAYPLSGRLKSGHRPIFFACSTFFFTATHRFLVPKFYDPVISEVHFQKCTGPNLFCRLRFFFLGLFFFAQKVDYAPRCTLIQNYTLLFNT